jgi:PAS domain S-box-containing protein
MEMTTVVCAIVEQSNDAIMYADQTGILRLWNHGSEKIFGYTMEEAVGQSLDQIIPEYLRERHWQGWGNAMASGTSRYSDELLAVPAMTKDGRNISIEFSVCIIRDDHGKPAGVAAIVRDVTARRQQERELKSRLARLEVTQA